MRCDVVCWDVVCCDVVCCDVVCCDVVCCDVVCCDFVCYEVVLCICCDFVCCDAVCVVMLFVLLVVVEAKFGYCIKNEVCVVYFQARLCVCIGTTLLPRYYTHKRYCYLENVLILEKAIFTLSTFI